MAGNNCTLVRVTTDNAQSVEDFITVLQEQEQEEKQTSNIARESIAAALQTSMAHFHELIAQ